MKSLEWVWSLSLLIKIKRDGVFVGTVRVCWDGVLVRTGCLLGRFVFVGTVRVCRDSVFVRTVRVCRKSYLHSIHWMQPFCVFSFVFLKMKHYFYTNINIYCTYKKKKTHPKERMSEMFKLFQTCLPPLLHIFVLPWECVFFILIVINIAITIIIILLCVNDNNKVVFVSTHRLLKQL